MKFFYHKWLNYMLWNYAVILEMVESGQSDIQGVEWHKESPSPAS